MKLLIIFFTLIFSDSLFAQEVIIKSQVGYGKIETDRSTLASLCTNVTALYEFDSHTSLYWHAGIGVTKYMHQIIDTLNQQGFKTIYIVILPITARKYFFLNSTARCFIDMGLVGSYYLLDKVEVKKPTATLNKKNSLGYNAGVTFSVGYKRAITSNIYFELSFSGSTDYLFVYKNRQEKLKTNNRMLSISFSKKLS